MCKHHISFLALKATPNKTFLKILLWHRFILSLHVTRRSNYRIKRHSYVIYFCNIDVLQLNTEDKFIIIASL